MLAAEARAARLEQLRLNVLAQETNFGLLSPGPRAHPAPAPAPVYETPAPEDDIVANLERRIEALESDDEEAPVLAAGHEPVEPDVVDEPDPFRKAIRRGEELGKETVEPVVPDLEDEAHTGPSKLHHVRGDETGPSKLHAAGDEDAAPSRDVEVTLDARFAKREAKVRASFLEATGSLDAYEHAGPDEAPDRTERQRIRARKRRLKRNRRRAGIAAAEALARAPLPAAEAPAPAYAEAPAPAYITTTPPASPERPPKDPAFTPTRERWYKRRVAGVPQSPDTPPAKSGRSLWGLLSRSVRKKKVSD